MCVREERERERTCVSAISFMYVQVYEIMYIAHFPLHFIYLSLCVRRRVRSQTHTHTHTSEHTHTHTHTNTQTTAQIHINVRLYQSVSWESLSVWSLFLKTFAHTRVRTFKSSHTHTHTHTYIYVCVCVWWFGLVSLFNGISTLFRLFNAKAILP